MPKCAFVRRNETKHQILVIYMTCTAFQILFKYSSLVRKLFNMGSRQSKTLTLLIMHYLSHYCIETQKQL